jgi:hypothetical protein
MVNTTVPGRTRLTPVQALQHLDVHDLDKAAVAPVADDADAPPHDAEFLEHLEQDAQRDGLAAAGAQPVVAEDQVRAVAGYQVRGGFGHPAASRMRSRIGATSSSGPKLRPDAWMLTPPMKRTALRS